MRPDPPTTVARVLPVEEYDRLIGTEAEGLRTIMRPDGQDGEVLVVQRGDEIVGCWALLHVWHAECLWIAPEHRGAGSVARRLWAFLRHRARLHGARSVATASQSATVDGLLEHVRATELPGRHYVMPVE